MKRKFKRWINAIVLFSVFSLAFNIWEERPHKPHRLLQNDWKELVGVIHFHTKYSDGGRNYPEIASIAQHQYLDFIIGAEHNSSKAVEDGVEGFFLPEGQGMNSVRILSSEERSTPFCRMILLQQPNMPFPKLEKEAQKIIDIVNKQNGLTFLVPPFNIHKEDDTWKLENFTGMEILNLEEIWKSNSWWKKWIGVLGYPFLGSVMNWMIDRPTEIISKWDELTSQRPVVGIGSADAHGRFKITDEYFFRWPSYSKVFQIVRTHLLTEQGGTDWYYHDRKLILNQLMSGSAFFAIDSYCDSRGFLFTANNGLNDVWSGQQIDLRDGVSLLVNTPDTSGVRIKFFRNGKMMRSIDSGSADFFTNQSGVFRVEVYQLRRKLPFWTLSERPWIFSNPIYVKSNTESESGNDPVE